MSSTSLNKWRKTMEIRFETLFEDQITLQEYLGNPMGEGAVSIRNNVLAMVAETMEFLNEVEGWKPWKGTHNKADQERKLRQTQEAADVLMFLMNACNELEIKPDELLSATRGKQLAGLARADSGEFCKKVES